MSVELPMSYDSKSQKTLEVVKAMEDASGISLDQFRRWYSQAGTPKLNITSVYIAVSYTHLTLPTKRIV